MADSTETLVHRYLHQKGTPTRVAARFVEKQARDLHSLLKNKIVGKDARFLWGEPRGGWSQPAFLIEELPQKGKKKLGLWSLNLDLSMFMRWSGMTSIYFSADDMAKKSGISSGDDFKSMVSKLEKAFAKEAEDLAKNVKEGRTKASFDPDEFKKNWQKELSYYPQKEMVFYLNVMPEGVQPFTAMGKDFQVSVKWDSFSSASPNSDYQLADPHYTTYTAKSPQAARTLFKILNADPEALRNLTWNQFSDWLNKNKIQYKVNFSSWG